MDSNFEWGDPHNYADTGLERQGGWSHAWATVVLLLGDISSHLSIDLFVCC